ncbi:hypothetical protein [Nocardioides astragali]|uniref:Uncharacterized protein n=1 Tax=Nocardioides astragali TaxID=1776736 RepID=A0ABW2N5L8_9ACTN|nr:hypothetical protein [Nocardioides astragali]
MPEHDTIPHDHIPLALEDLTARVRKLELENLQLRKENLFVQLQLMALERGRALDDSDHDTAVTWDQLRALRDRIESID